MIGALFLADDCFPKIWEYITGTPRNAWSLPRLEGER